MNPRPSTAFPPSWQMALLLAPYLAAIILGFLFWTVTGGWRKGRKRRRKNL